MRTATRPRPARPTEQQLLATALRDANRALKALLALKASVDAVPGLEETTGEAYWPAAVWIEDMAAGAVAMLNRLAVTGTVTSCARTGGAA